MDATAARHSPTAAAAVALAVLLWLAIEEEEAVLLLCTLIEGREVGFAQFECGRVAK